MYFRTYGLPKTWLEQCVKSPVSEDPSKSHMVKAQNIVQTWSAPTLPHFLITAQSAVVHKASVGDMQNLKTVS